MTLRVDMSKKRVMEAFFRRTIGTGVDLECFLVGFAFSHRVSAGYGITVIFSDFLTAGGILLDCSFFIWRFEVDLTMRQPRPFVSF